MSDAEKISQAISAHANWKLRLKTAIDTGRSEWSVDRVSPDNLCDFGKWLYSLPKNEQQNQNWIEVQALHAAFHKEAAQVLGLALDGKQQEARGRMAFDSNYAKISARLTWAMMEWRKSINAPAYIEV